MKKWISLVICFALMSLIACGNKQSEENQEQINQPQETVEEAPEIIRPQITLSKQGYEDFWVISDKYILFMENGKYGVMDYEEQVVLPAEYDFGNNLYAQKMVLLGNKVENEYECKLFDENMQQIFQNDNYREFTIASVNEGVLQLVNSDLSCSIYLDMQNDYQELFRLSEEEVEGFYSSTAFSNGYVLVCTNIYLDEGFPNIVDKEGNILFLTQNKKMYYTYISYAIGEDGWILCYEVDMEHPDQFANGFLNINTREFVPLPEDKSYVKQVRGKDGIYHATYQNLALISEESQKDEYYVFDITNQRIINQNPYGYVELNDYGRQYILYATQKNEKWGYLDSQFRPTQFLYEDASSFSEDGYAWIYQDGMEYLINQEGVIVSDGYEGQEVSRDFGLFKLVNGEKKYFVIVE